MVKLFQQAGIHVSTHAVGDRAIDWVVDTYSDLLKQTPTKHLRHGIIHCNIPTDHAIDTMARLQRDFDAGYPETQAPFLWWIGDIYHASFGTAREQRLMPYKTYTQKGIVWAGGSDYFVTPFPARYGLWASIARQTSSGTQPFGTAESVDIHSALKSYTIWAAHQLFLEDRIGSLEPGKDADIAVWDRDPYSIPTDAIKDMRCELTCSAAKSSTTPLQPNPSDCIQKKAAQLKMTSFADSNMNKNQQPALALFVIGLLGLGVLALHYRDFALVWQPVPAGVPARAAVACASGVLMIALGVGLLIRRTRLWSVRILFPYLALWASLKLHDVVTAPGTEASWLGLGELTPASRWRLDAVCLPGRGVAARLPRR
jgi:hypothetical protein